MLEKPDLQDEQIIQTLRAHYDLPVNSVEFLPIGNDATAWVYRADADGEGKFFLKVKKGDIDAPSLSVPHFLREQGIEQVVAPLPTTTGALWAGLDSFALILHPFVEGPTGMDAGLSDDQWRTFGAALRRIHEARLPADLAGQVRRETFVPQWSRMVRELDAQMGGGFDDPYRRELAACWADRREEIIRIVKRCEELGRRLSRRSGPFVLCHTDIHTANILLDADHSLHIVDWDTPMLAPVERDLMFIRDGVTIQTHTERCFFEGYGETNIDPVALAYYRYEWVVQEIGDYGERVFLADSGQETKADSVQGFRQLFDPGDVADVAYAADERVPPEQ